MSVMYNQIDIELFNHRYNNSFFVFLNLDLLGNELHKFIEKYLQFFINIRCYIVTEYH